MLNSIINNSQTLLGALTLYHTLRAEGVGYQKLSDFEPQYVGVTSGYFFKLYSSDLYNQLKTSNKLFYKMGVLMGVLPYHTIKKLAHKAYLL